MIDSLRRALNRLRAFLKQQPLDRDLDAELGSHLEFAVEENIRRGMSAEEARRQALIRFGGVARAAEDHRETRGLPAADVLLKDLRYSLQAVARNIDSVTYNLEGTARNMNEFSREIRQDPAVLLGGGRPREETGPR